MTERFCNTCTYFKQHYTFDDRRIFQVYCGHCTFSAAKRKRPDAKTCEHYMTKETGETPFVSKEYLSKKLLEYLLQLELLPQIEEWSE